jgi:DNA helicase TIP49 (TBP-interacting protein)
MVNETKVRITYQMSNVLRSTGDQIVHANHIIAIGKKAIAQMRSQESGSAGNQYSRHKTDVIEAMIKRKLKGQCLARLL